MHHAAASLLTCSDLPQPIRLSGKHLQEYCEGGDLRNALTNPDLDEYMRWDRHGHELFMDIACGLAYLHQKQVCYPEQAIRGRAVPWLPMRGLSSSAAPRCRPAGWCQTGGSSRHQLECTAAGLCTCGT